MLMLKKMALIGASALAVSGVSAAAVQAQPWGYARPAYDSSRLTTSYVDSLDWRITNAAQRGVISWPQARNLRGQLRSARASPTGSRPIRPATGNSSGSTPW